MMKLLLLRHGIAADPTPDRTDADRPLTEAGVKKTRNAIAGLARIIDPPQIILTSPKLRALQTAEIAANILEAPVKSIEILAGGAADQVIDRISRREEQLILAVGHEPILSEVVELLCFGRTTSAVQMKKAGCACIQSVGRLQIGQGLLEWLATPKMLCQLRN